MKPIFALFIRALRESNQSISTLFVRLFVGFIFLLCLMGSQGPTGWSGAPGKTFFSSLIAVNYALVTAMAVGVGAQAIAGEKETGSLGLLRLTDLDPLSILLGKCVGQLIGLLLLLAFQIPFTLLAVTLGGVATQQVFAAYALLGTYLIALTCLGLFFSVVLTKVWRAVIMTLAVCLGLTLLPVCLESMSDRLNPTGLLWDQQKQTIVNPSPERPVETSVSPLEIKVANQLQRAAAWIETVTPWTHSRQLTGGSSQSIQISRSLLVHATFAAFFFGLAWLLFDRYCGDESRYGESRKGQPIRQRFRFFRLPRATHRPVAWKDFHFNFGGRLWFILRLLAYPIIAAIVIFQSSPSITREAIVNGTWIVGLLVLYLDLSFFVIRSWGPEVWDRNLSQLVLTPRSMPQLNLQKLVALAVALIPSCILPFAALAMDQYRETGTITWRGVLIYLSIAAQSLFFFSLCLNLSIRVRWAALLGATAGWIMARYLVRGGLMMVTLPFLARGRWTTSLFEVIEAIEIFVFLAAAAAVYFAFQRQLLRCAAES
jgi:ABC-type transport system involved in multi-copper enzyme maturation permease subunit